MKRSNSTYERGTTGPEVLVELAAGDGPLGARIEGSLREGARSGRLTAGIRLPSSRTLARDLGISRRAVVDAYAQLVAEGWLVARQGAGTFVAAAAHESEPLPRQLPVPPPRPRYDFFPGIPDLAAFPRALWLRTVREVLADAPDAALHYPDPAGVPELRTALAAYLGRVRNVQAGPERVLITAGARQAIGLIARAIGRDGSACVAVEWPSIPDHIAVLRAAGAEVIRIPVDEEGIDVASLAAGPARAVLITPAHQFPMGMALSGPRRAALLEWVLGADGRLIIEDDYDAEFRYDRRPVGALQGRAPDHVAYVGSTSKTLAPGLRLGWTVLPAALAPAVIREKRLDDAGNAVVDQLVLARLLQTAAYDRHIRAARRRNRRRREALAGALARALPDVRLEGLAAGLHAVARLPRPVDAQALVVAAAARSVGVYPLPGADGRADVLILGYAALSEPAIEAGVSLLAEALAGV